MCDDGANSADPSVQRDHLAAELQRRCDEIAARIEQLRDRSQELANRCPRGSTTEEVAKAQAHARRARRYAQKDFAAPGR